jgi:hypothetical protein
VNVVMARSQLAATRHESGLQEQRQRPRTVTRFQLCAEPGCSLLLAVLVLSDFMSDDSANRGSANGSEHTSTHCVSDYGPGAGSDCRALLRIRPGAATANEDS